EAQQKREREILKSLSFGLFQPANDNHFIPVREMEATEKLVKAQNKGNNKEIMVATEELAKLREMAKAAKYPELLPTTPTDPEKAAQVKAQMEKANLIKNGGQ
ncbi:MAG: hypothetical protein J0L55_15585, partial [Caulobacterales bacterium]|nr:hypothetical protein [Caulobacterales bacterium]